MWVFDCNKCVKAPNKHHYFQWKSIYYNICLHYHAYRVQRKSGDLVVGNHFSELIALPK